MDIENLKPILISQFGAHLGMFLGQHGIAGKWLPQFTEINKSDKFLLRPLT